MENWAEKTIQVMNTKMEGTRERELRFFRLDELKRNIHRIGQFGSNCPVCEDFKAEVEAVFEHVNEAVNVPGPERRELDRLIFRLSNHMLKEHDFYPPNHYYYLYSVAGVIGGALAGFLLMEWFTATKWYLPAAGLVVGFFAGMISGIMKDRRIKRERKMM